MEMTGSYRIAAPRDRVWEALNDPEVLKDCIPGCESLEQLSETEMQAAVTAKIGPVKARFTGKVTLSDLVPPESYTITGEGSGGAAGFAKGGADVGLSEEGEETVLTYAVKAQVGGKIAQLGARLIDGVAKKMADDFFARFTAHVGGADPTDGTDVDETPDEQLVGSEAEFGPGEVPGAPSAVISPVTDPGVPGAPSVYPPQAPVVPSSSDLAAILSGNRGLLLAAGAAVLIVLFYVFGR